MSKINKHLLPIVRIEYILTKNKLTQVHQTHRRTLSYQIDKLNGTASVTLKRFSYAENGNTREM